MAGGTGGHVFPALAVADELRARGVEVVWLGTRRGIESEVVPKANIEIAYINIAGLRGKGMLDLVYAPFKLIAALAQAISVLRRLQPAAVLGMGGFVTGPGGIAAWLLRKPLLVHEQNAIAGLTNRLLRPFATRVMEAFPRSLQRAMHTGNPVRKDIAALHDTEKTAPTGQLKLLVVGGSLGAKALNEVVPEALAQLEPAQRPVVWHQTGKKLIDDTRAIYERHQLSARVDPFIDDMAAAYQWADLIMCRAGAMTIAEIAIVGLASILVPYPFAVDDHQTYNARYLSDAGAAILIQQADLSSKVLLELLQSLDASRIHTMSQSARKLALPQATTQVADQCMEVACG
jgi:UDP-N-acetylglucosamine--N-acetylmuramyl-(pentapeptide) pyrophosphoryl-undecaprenol N-acetylglucosamine transferase